MKIQRDRMSVINQKVFYVTVFSNEYVHESIIRNLMLRAFMRWLLFCRDLKAGKNLYGTTPEAITS